MKPKKTVQQRQQELQGLLSTAAGRQQLEDLEARYQAASGRLRPRRSSVITYLLVFEREQGLIGQ
jgi:hypothetical protein